MFGSSKKVAGEPNNLLLRICMDGDGILAHRTAVSTETGGAAYEVVFTVTDTAQDNGR
jgi:hypothetical protein